MISKARIEEILDALNSYEGDNRYQDVEYPMPEYDDEMTRRLGGESDDTIIALTDGTVLHYTFGGRDSVAGWFEASDTAEELLSARQ